VKPARVILRRQIRLRIPGPEQVRETPNHRFCRTRALEPRGRAGSASTVDSGDGFLALGAVTLRSAFKLDQALARAEATR
jgi:hypothetical protein